MRNRSKQEHLSTIGDEIMARRRKKLMSRPRSEAKRRMSFRVPSGSIQNRPIETRQAYPTKKQEEGE